MFVAFMVAVFRRQAIYFSRNSSYLDVQFVLGQEQVFYSTSQSKSQFKHAAKVHGGVIQGPYHISSNYLKAPHGKQSSSNFTNPSP